MFGFVSGFVTGFVSVIVSGMVFRSFFVNILFERTSVNQRGPSEPPEVFVCVCNCVYKCDCWRMRSSIKTSNKKLNCFFHGAFPKTCAHFPRELIGPEL